MSKSKNATSPDPPPTATVLRTDGVPVTVPPDLEPEPTSNGRELTVIPQPATALSPTPSRPSTFAGALALAQQRCKVAMCDGVNARGKGYPSAETIIRVANEALEGTGLATFPMGHAPLAPSEINLAGKEWLLLAVQYEVQHEAGECRTFKGCWPVLFEKGRTVEDAFKITLTRALADFLRMLLRIEREVKAGPPADGGEEAKAQRAAAAAAKRAANGNANGNGGVTHAPATHAPPAQTPLSPAQQAAATSEATPMATTPPTPAPPLCSIQTLNDLQSLRAEMFGLMGLGGDQQAQATTWAAILAKRGVTTASNLSPTQGEELAANLRSRIVKIREETQATGDTFPPAGGIK
jgi:hypothetical protein